MGLRYLQPEDWLDRLRNASSELEWNEISWSMHGPEWRAPHITAPLHIVVFVGEGVLEARVDAGHFPQMDRNVNAARPPANPPSWVEPGQAVWISPGVGRAFRPKPETGPLRLFRCTFNLRQAGDEICPDPPCRILQDQGDLPSLMEMLLDEYRRMQRFRDQRLRSLLEAFASHLFRLPAAEKERHHSDRTLRPVQRTRLHEFVEERMAAGFTVADIAAEMKLTPDYFSRLFRSTYGLSPRAWLKRERLGRARLQLSETVLSVKEIAAGLGYGNSRFLCREFKKQYHLTPTEYRSRLSRTHAPVGE